jgi:pimeloyl-ACP methyl ester carboxylesterase
MDSRGFRGKRIVMGRSLGAHPALDVAANANAGFNGLIIESGAGNMRRLAARFGVDSGEAADLVAAHDQKIASIALPTLFLHGERDDLIPIESAVELYGLIGSVQKAFVPLQGAGHNDLLWLRAKEYFEAIREFLTLL